MLEGFVNGPNSAWRGNGPAYGGLHEFWIPLGTVSTTRGLLIFPKMGNSFLILSLFG
jgi:hypothetical protein